MSESNPYATPNADLRGSGTSGGRPAWVWIIFIFYVLSAVGTLFSFNFVFSGAIKLPEVQQAVSCEPSVFDHAMTVIMMGINVVAAVQLFRLRRISVYLFPSALLLGSSYRVACRHQRMACRLGRFPYYEHDVWLGNCRGDLSDTWHLARKGILK